MPSIWMPLVPKHQECADELSCMLDNSPQDISPPRQLATNSRQLAPKLGQLALSQDNSPPMKKIYFIHI